MKNYFFICLLIGMFNVASTFKVVSEYVRNLKIA